MQDRTVISGARSCLLFHFVCSLQYSKKLIHIYIKTAEIKGVIMKLCISCPLTSPKEVYRRIRIVYNDGKSLVIENNSVILRCIIR